ncbi:MAG: zinc ribbon domain-containing protein [Chloroflexi bacterium]|jgi:putative FmdB family regulatory protein|nr:zinc ribbon domain-containing protein [Chloroflexota bacterium]MBT7080885.1 zinc ribbon domain-containing protein [Chloroflexota bacterium]MBT7290783.1 zinc ribbon domain-containing protein [Chloroflexota bacterium]
MPTYEYKCKNCGEKFDEVKKIEALENKAVCPKCKSDNTQRVFNFASLFGTKAGDSCGTARHT